MDLFAQKRIKPRHGEFLRSLKPRNVIFVG